MPNLVEIDDLHDPRIQAYRDIRERDLVGRAGLFVAEGRVVVEKLVGSALHQPLSLLIASEEIKRCQRIGIEAPEPVPHPDDVILDPNTGNVRVAGPLTAEQKKKLDRALERRADAQEEVDYFVEKYRRARDPAKKAQWLSDWHWEQRMFDIVNDIVPERCKAKLSNRSYREGASREGKALEELNASRALRDDYLE